MTPLLNPFVRRGDALYAEGVSLEEIARRYGHPCYVYSRAAIEARWRAFAEAFRRRDALICYAVKANSNLTLLRLLAQLGAGFDIVSGGELERVLRAGGDPARVVFSGVGKSDAEVRRALAVGIRCFNVESASELEQIDAVAGALGRRAPVALRVNPDVEAGGHAYINTGRKEDKFGLSMGDAEALYRRAATMAHVDAAGIAFHIGSQIVSTRPFAAALERALALVDRLRDAGLLLRHIDLGGGLGVRYRAEHPPSVEAYAQALLTPLEGRDLRPIIAPGRALTAEAGLLLTRVVHLKMGREKSFCVVDAAMNDLLRPALYQGWHEIAPVRLRDEKSDDDGARLWEIVGPVCESGDFLGRERRLNLRRGDLLAALCAGAYGFVMASNYNSRPRPPEVWVEGDAARLIRPRESVEALFAAEEALLEEETQRRA